MKNIIFLFIITFFINIVAFSQQQQTIPLDPKVRVGTLKNGLTYYIRHNERPKERADFYIVQKVGSILEEEPQRGLAHFLEHMCFNGTKNFPGNLLIKELEAKGIKFGVNLNAYTDIDETVYNLSNIPVKHDGLVDTMLLVLHDWSGFVSLNDKDIDDERGVIHEEWRTRRTAGFRAMEKTLKDIYPHSRYAERLPIGLIDVIDNFKYQEIRDYYKKWYHPDLQGIIVVGDVDVDEVEAKMKTIFADIPAPVNVVERPYYKVSDNSEPIVSVSTDPEIEGTGISVYYKRENIPDSLKNTQSYFVNKIVEHLITSMFNLRMYELSQKPNPPFVRAGGGVGDFYVAKTKRAWTVSVNPRNNKEWAKSLKTILLENERMQRFGFTASEFERSKTNLLRSYESLYNERDQLENKTYVDQYVQNFLNNEPYATIEWQYNYAKAVLEKLPLEVVNGLASSLVPDTNVVFTYTGPEKEDLDQPSKKDILNIWEEVKNAEVEPYVDDTIDQPLLEKEPKSGKIRKIEKTAFGYEQWTLSNGVKVLIKKTDFKKDQVLFSAYSPGGISLIDNEDLTSAKVVNSVVDLGGLGNFSSVELNKILTGKKVSIAPFMSSLSEGISGSCSPRDFETLLQLNYLYFTQPRMDDNAFNNWKANFAERLKNASSNPATSLKDTLNKIMYADNVRAKKIDTTLLAEVDYNKAISLYRERFANAGDFTFFITGNVEPDSIKEVVEKYLGSLPSSTKREQFHNWNILPPKGIVQNHFSRELETPKSTVINIYTGEVDFNLKNLVLMNYLKSILDIIYTEKIREKEGGAYGISVNGNINKYPEERFSFQVSFDTNPSVREKLTDIVFAEIDKISTQNPDENIVDKVKKYMLKSHSENLVYNSYWDNAIKNVVINDIDMVSDYEKVVDSVTPDMIREFAHELFSQKNIVEVSMNPK